MPLPRRSGAGDQRPVPPRGPGSPDGGTSMITLYLIIGGVLGLKAADKLAAAA